MPSKVDFLKAKVEAVKNVLEKTTPKERENRVTLHLAEEFNSVLKEIGTAFPDAAPHLPKPIPCVGFRRLGVSDVGYVDLMVFAEQVLRILSVVESHG